MSKRIVASATVGGLAMVAVLLGVRHPGVAQTFPASDTPAGYLVFPKLVVDITSNQQAQGTAQVDTMIQLTNTSTVSTRIVHCFYRDEATCGEVDFFIDLTINQPFEWRVSKGSSNPLIPGPPDSDPDPDRFAFIGELKCVEVNSGLNPVPINANDLKGEATIYSISDAAVDTRSYNAIGFQTLSTNAAAQNQNCINGTNPGDVCTVDANCKGGGTCGVVMCLGSVASTECASAEYVGCPSTLILNNFFDGAPDPVSTKTIRTDLTLVPCTENLTLTGVESQQMTTAQFLIFNEFEQRFSTSMRVQCFRETQLSRIDAKEGAEDSSVFNYAVQGTLTGQTRIRGVATSETTIGHGLLAVAEEFHGPGSVAVNLNEVGTNSGKADFVRSSVKASQF